MLQYTSNFSLFRYVFPQTIVVWLTGIIFLNHKDKIEHYLFLMLPTMLYGTLSFIGIVPLAIGYVIEYLIRNKDVKNTLIKIFSLDNILSLLSLGSLEILYLFGNVVGDKPGEVGFGLMPYTKDNFMLYVVFVICCVLIYLPFLYKDNKKTVSLLVRY